MQKAQVAPRPVSRIHVSNTMVHWPTKRQMKRRSCTPYIEYSHNGVKWRAHLHLYDTDERPDVVMIKIQGEKHVVYFSQSGPDGRRRDSEPRMIQVGKKFAIASAN